jgi:hypothetical protein
MDRGKQIQGLIQFHVYIKPNPDYTALCKDLKKLKLTSSEVYEIVRQVQRGAY